MSQRAADGRRKGGRQSDPAEPESDLRSQGSVRSKVVHPRLDQISTNLSKVCPASSTQAGKQKNPFLGRQDTPKENLSPTHGRKTATDVNIGSDRHLLELNVI